MTKEVQLTPGQRCILDLLQRKLLKTIQSYAKLCLEQHNELERQRLKEKIRKISARQKRFTLEIVNGNGNNTLPKESFLEALGLVTKEALTKLNSKSSERRRRTTANPRFSHEAIQAKRALEPIRTRRPHRQPNNQSQSQPPPPPPPSSQPTQTPPTTNQHHNTNTSAHKNQNTQRGQLLNQYTDLQKRFHNKMAQIKAKQASNKLLERQNELIRKRGLDIITAINMMNQGAANQGEGQPIDLWLDMKCDESLDALD